MSQRQASARDALALRAVHRGDARIAQRGGPRAIRVRGSLLGALAAFLMAAAPTCHAQSDTAVSTASYATDVAVSFAALRLNGQPASESALILRSGQGGQRLLLGELDALALRLDRAQFGEPVEYDKQLFFPLDGVAGLSYEFDAATQTLSLNAAPNVFVAERMNVGPAPAPPAERPGIGGFVSYDLLLQRGNAAGFSSFSSGQFELGAFSPYGVFTQTALAASRGERRALRLDSTYTLDQPGRLASLRLGDSIARPAGWSNAVRFGGIQYGTNFGVQPGLVTYPLNSMSGEAGLPSVVDVYVNNVLAGSQRVPAGAFTLNELPTVNGQGELKLVVRDLLGREQTILEPLYGSTTLLRAGLDDFTLQAGRLREDYGLASGKYGRGFAAGLWRRGITDRLTLEGSAEAARSHGVVGAGANWLMGDWGRFGASAAYAEGHAPTLHGTSMLVPVNTFTAPLPVPGAGANAALAPSLSRLDDATLERVHGYSLWLAWEYRASSINFGGQARWNSPRFRSVMQGDLAPPRRQMTAFASRAFGSASVSAAYTLLSRPNEDRAEFVQLTLGKSLRKSGFLSLTGIKTVAGPRNDSIFLNYALPLDDLTIVNASSSAADSWQGASRENRILLQRSLPQSDGYGYRIDATDRSRASAEWRAQNRSGVYSVAAARAQGEDAVRLGAAGSFTFLGGELAAGRRIEDGFGLVQVPDYAGVRVYLDNREIGRTNDEGNLFVPRLRPYQANSLAIDQGDLPLTAAAPTLKLNATPYRKSGVVVRFPVEELHGGIVRVVDESGHPIPAGAVVTKLDTWEEFPIAANGEAFLTGLKPSNRVLVESAGRRCELSLDYRRTNDPQPLLGTLTCALKP